ncbi:helix-turn-helix transcriptional regulator [Bosea sp. LjRoot90]|uniref:winged helix-turn-helix transcriptional regulator n=1 Tax=Bosea sp. LjRoot90 TaxID=3342342 RepID=UPI003ECDDE85
MGWSEVGGTVCPIARALAVVGDRWTMLILRELFLATRRFEEFQAQTGMSSHLLSSRLKRLEADGVICRRRYSDRPARHEYRLTEKGLALYPILLGLKSWGERWGGFDANDQPAIEVVHCGCGQATGLTLTCSACNQPFGARDARAVIGETFAVERAERRSAFRGHGQR